MLTLDLFLTSPYFSPTFHGSCILMLQKGPKLINTIVHGAHNISLKPTESNLLYTRPLTIREGKCHRKCITVSLSWSVVVTHVLAE